MASILEGRIRARALAFALELDALVREVALRAITDTLARSRRSGLGVSAEGGRRTSKRGSAEIAALMGQIRVYVAEHPGHGVEAISRGLGLLSKDLALPIKRLLAAGEIAKEGEKRSTRYFPA